MGQRLRAGQQGSRRGWRLRGDRFLYGLRADAGKFPASRPEDEEEGLMKNANDERNAEVSRLRRPISAAVTNLVESMDQGTDV